MAFVAAARVSVTGFRFVAFFADHLGVVNGICRNLCFVAGGADCFTIHGAILGAAAAETALADVMAEPAGAFPVITVHVHLASTGG
jgi:hypothetical protein